MTPEQYRLVNRSTAPWLTLWLLADFESGRSYAVGAMGGGTYHFGDERGQYETTSKGMSAWRRDRTSPDVTVTWSEVKRWAESRPTDVRATAAELRSEGQRISSAYPPVYPSIGRPYHWDMQATHAIPTCEQCEQDRADLTAAQAKRDEQVREWRAAKAEYDERVKTFLATLAPEAELTLFDGLAVTP